jgi:cytochrome c oxidase subunit 2
MFLHALVAASSAPNNLNLLDPSAAPADSIRDIFWLVVAVCTVIGILVEGFLIYCVVRFRQRPTADDHEPPQMYGSQPIEVAWTMAPLLTVFVLFLVVIRSVAEILPSKPPDDALQVTVKGHQWWWEYQYPDLGVTTANELHVPVDTPVFFRLESVDVVHSFWFPRLAGKTDVVPGHPNTMWFRVSEPGIYKGQCAEYCGTQHANMILYAVVEPKADFDAWIARQKQPARTDPGVGGGATIFFKHNCVDCHTIRDGSARARGTFGPDLTHLASRTTLASAMVDNDKEWLTKWMHNPQAVKPGCWMPDFHFDENEVKELVEYLQSLE